MCDSTSGPQNSQKRNQYYDSVAAAKYRECLRCVAHRETFSTASTPHSGRSVPIHSNSRSLVHRIRIRCDDDVRVSRCNERLGLYHEMRGEWQSAIDQYISCGFRCLSGSLPRVSRAYCRAQLMRRFDMTIFNDLRDGLIGVTWEPWHTTVWRMERDGRLRDVIRTFREHTPMDSPDYIKLRTIETIIAPTTLNTKSCITFN